MALQLQQIIETQGAPNAVTSPLLTFLGFEVGLAAGANGLIRVNVTGGNLATGFDQILGATPWLSGHVLAGNVAGGALSIESSWDGVAIWDPIFTMNLIGLNYPNVFGPLEIPGWNIRIRLWNPAGVLQTFDGLILGKAN